MKRLLLILALLLSNAAGAAPVSGQVSFSLYGVTLPDLVRVIVDDVAGASVVVSPEALQDHSEVNFVLKNSTVQGALDNLTRLLKDRGFALEKVGGVFHLAKAKETETDVLVYLPKYRSVSYLTDLIGGIIPRAAIVNQRMIGQQTNQQMQPVQMQPGQNQQGQYQAIDNGSNAYSMLDKSDKDALVIKATAKELEQVKKMLAQVDRPVPEMLVKAVLMEVQTGETEGSAINLLATLIAKGVGGINLAWEGGADVKNGITFKVGGIEAVWSAISTDTRFKVVSSPQLRVKSGGSARMSVGADTPILGAISYQGNGQSQQSVEYKPSGVILELRPEIRGAIAELKVMQQLSSFKKTETGVNNSPTLLKRELSTSVMVSQNDVVLLGGLEETKNTSSKEGFFFMPEFMRSTFGDNSKSEIVLMLYVERVQTAGEGI